MTDEFAINILKQYREKPTLINDIRSCISVEGYWAILERLKKLPPVKPRIFHTIPRGQALRGKL